MAEDEKAIEEIFAEYQLVNVIFNLIT